MRCGYTLTAQVILVSLLIATVTLGNSAPVPSEATTLGVSATSYAGDIDEAVIESTIRVLDPSGGPVQGATVQIESSKDLSVELAYRRTSPTPVLSWSRNARPTFETDADGIVTIRAMNDRDVLVVAHEKGFFAGLVGHTIRQSEIKDILLEPWSQWHLEDVGGLAGPRTVFLKTRSSGGITCSFRVYLSEQDHNAKVLVPRGQTNVLLMGDDTGRTFGYIEQTIDAGKSDERASVLRLFSGVRVVGKVDLPADSPYVGIVLKLNRLDNDGPATPQRPIMVESPEQRLLLMPDDVVRLSLTKQHTFVAAGLRPGRHSIEAHGTIEHDSRFEVVPVAFDPAVLIVPDGPADGQLSSLETGFAVTVPDEHRRIAESLARPR